MSEAPLTATKEVKGFEEYVPDAWVLAAKPSEIAIIVHNASALGSVCNTAAVDNAGAVFVTNWGEETSVPSRYGKLPEYFFSEEIADC